MIVTVFRDRWLQVVDKPQGLPTQADRTGDEDLASLLRREVSYLGLHHRLDRAASGLVLFTVDRAANKAVAALFREHAIRRTYLAVLWGELPGPVTWDREIEGLPARTRVRPTAAGGGLVAAQIQLDTGRKHQIRVHAALAGTPVVGDRRYGGEAGRRWPRLALHAAELAFTHPFTGTRVELRSDLPADLVALWGEAGAPPRA